MQLQNSGGIYLLEPEFNMMGRTCEKILQVDFIPTTFQDDDEYEDNDPNRKEYLAKASM
jgi:hypothetical protein